MALAVAALDSPDRPDPVRVCMTMTAAGVAVAVLPYALLVGLFAGVTWFRAAGPMLGEDDATGTARVLLLCTLVASSAAVGAGARAAWRARTALAPHGRVKLWLTVVASTLALWCLPPLLLLTSLWMLVGTTLATRPLRWALAASGPLDREDVRSLRRQGFCLTVVIVVLAHVAAWIAVVATAARVPAEEFARVDAVRRGETVEPRPWDSTVGPADADVSGLTDHDALLGGGATAAERYVGGDVSVWPFALGYWPDIAQTLIAPAPEGPTREESWAVAALAFLLSLLFWIPAATLWSFVGTLDVRGTEPRALGSNSE